jgi:hypothetical protein
VIKFSDPIQAKRGISQLHGLKLLDKTLSVDFAKQSIEYVFVLFFKGLCFLDVEKLYHFN